MHRMVGLSVFVLLASCGGRDAVPLSKFWTVTEFVAKADSTAVFGEFKPGELVNAPGAPLAFRSGPWESPPTVQRGDAHGLTIFPAFSEGQVAAYTVTEIWENHPRPWVQPVYIPVTSLEPLKRDFPALPPTIFPVGIKSSFYTPFWRAVYFQVPRDTPVDAYTSVASVVNAKLPMLQGALVTCPIVPPDMLLGQADGAGDPVRPFTFDVLTRRGVASAWVNGDAVKYADFGAGAYEVDAEDQPIEAAAYFFVTEDLEGVRHPLPLPAVLGPGALNHAFYRRYDVIIDRFNRVFVPKGQSELRAHLEALGASAPEISTSLTVELSRRYTLVVTASGSDTCLNPAIVDSPFPGTCALLDSEANIKKFVPVRRIVRTEAIFTAPVLLAEGQLR